jgi:hypothetical protein
VETEELKALFAFFLIAFATPAAAKPANDIVGHYYLNGVRETGSELLITADGRYQWYISYGAVDQSSIGKWSRSNDRVVLTPDQPEQSGPPVKLGKVRPWDEAAERRYRAMLEVEAVAAMVKRCPLRGAVSAPSTWSSSVNEKTDWAVFARQAVIDAKAVKVSTDAALAQWANLPDGTPEWDIALAAAARAIGDYEHAQDVARYAHAQANMTPPVLPAIAYPARCDLPAAIEDSDPLQGKWHPHIAVLARDPSVGMHFVDSKFTLIFSDGVHVDTVTGSGGWAFVPMRVGRNVTAILIAGEDAQMKGVALPVVMSGAGVLTVEVNSAAFAKPAFETLTLIVNDRGDLLPQGWSQGRYSKAN